MRLLASVAASICLLLFLARPVFADTAPPVVVVEISGAIDDAEALRAAIGAELHATVVPPDDPRAASARGRLAIEARGDDKRLQATYRSLGAPVSRTVDLPADPRRARNVAVLLAGNVAREEADELLNGMKKPSTPPVPVTRTTEDEDLRRLRVILGELGSGARGRRTWVGIESLIEGGLSLGAGTAFALQEGERRRFTRSAGVGLLINGTASTTVGLVLLLAGPGDPYERMSVDLETAAARSGAQAAVKTIESRWAAEAEAERRARKLAGWLGIVVGTVGAGVGLALPAVVPAEQQDELVPAVAVGMVVVNGMLLATAIDLLFTPSSIEQSWLTYKTMKGTASSALPGLSSIRPQIGFAPASGGGTVGVGFRF